MRWEVAINVHETIEETLHIAKKCDEKEMDQVWVIDFPAPRFALPVASKIASMTSIRIGIGVISPLIYDTEQIVRFVDTLSREFGDRFDVLIGPGDRLALQRIGHKHWIPKHIVEKVTSDTHTIKQELIAKGHENCKVLLAAQGPRMIASSTKTDGVLLNYTDPDMIAWATRYLGEHSSDSSRNGVFIPSLLVDDMKDLPPNNLLYSAAIVALGAPSKVIQDFSIPQIDTARNILKSTGNLSDDIIKSIGVNLLKRWALYSTPEGTVEYARTLEEMKIGRIVFGPPMAHSSDSIDVLLEAFESYTTRGQ